MNNHFFIIGAQRSGTTLLTKILDSHEQISMAKPIKPEPKFFLNSIKLFNYNDYFDKFFDNKGNVRIFGEKSTSYIESKIAAKQIKKYLPNSKLIIILRDPVKRAISNYFFSINNNLEKMDFEEALRNENNRILNKDDSASVSPFAYFSRGIYINYLEYWLKFFERQNILILVFEDLILNKKIDFIYDFLMVDKSMSKTFFSKENKSKGSKIMISNKIIETLAKKYYPYNIALAQKFNLDVSYWHGMK